MTAAAALHRAAQPAEISDQGPAAALAPSDPDLDGTTHTEVAVIGDSFTSEGGWPKMLFDSLAAADPRTFDVDVSYNPGCGYTTCVEEQRSFGLGVPEVVTPETDLVIVMGTRNDRHASGPVIEAAASALYEEASQIAPDARLLVIGPVWQLEPVEPGVLVAREAVRAAASAAGADYIDPLDQRWFFDHPELTSSDNVHPTREGQAYMAELLVPQVAPIVTEIAAQQ